MEKYPLAPLLKVREYREDAAKNALSAAERAVVEAQEAVERCRGELERYKVWRQEEVERRYDAIMGKKKASALLKDAAFVDEYRGKQIPQGKKSVTIRLTIGSDEKTLTSQEIESAANQVMKKLGKKMGAELRTQ